MQDFAEVYEEHVWTVYGFFAYRLGSRVEAEDFTQLTFERALKAWERYDERRAKVGTWLLTIAHHLLIDHYRRARPLPFDARTDVEGGEPAIEASEATGLDSDLAAALATLGEREREVLALRFGGDLAASEIAEMLDMSVANVQQILSRSLRKLRVLLESPVGG